MQIDAHLDDSYARKFKQLKEIENKSTHEILTEALDAYFAAKLDLEKEEARLNNQIILKQLGGVVSDLEDGSRNYKQYVTEYLDEKCTNR